MNECEYACTHTETRIRPINIPHGTYCYKHLVASIQALSNTVELTVYPRVTIDTEELNQALYSRFSN